ncbi:uncharacterized protein TM35_000371080 [Trypanosoma theileri]|uniref:Uncharacterized protein n=1 Tax=Trypanosoma theileri TaxID=67003 RepID=A0A1X0NK76_9TRYP|nr:uncharacterized protein TM35_000371080 [Trypanosoma theileri]ORC85135.1 hypothetical protein TM35_000371080 [Trypanosoma theileri]
MSCSSSSSSSSSNCDDVDGAGICTAAGELAAQIEDCASVLTCIDSEVSVRSIQPLSPRGSTVTACVTWRTTPLLPPSPQTRTPPMTNTTETQSVTLRFSYSGGFTCGENSGSASVYESLMSLLLANGCGVRKGA